MAYDSPTSTKEYGKKAVKEIEQRTGRPLADILMWTALGTVVGALSFQLARKRHTGLFLGQLTPSLLMLGLYNKLSKMESERV